MFRFLRLTLPATAALAFVLPWPAHAGWETVKPELRLLELEPWSLCNGCASFKVQNAGNVPAGSFSVRVSLYRNGAWVKSVIKSFGPLAAHVTDSAYVVFGTPVDDCDVILVGTIDHYNTVSESNETNNTTWYYAPDC
jgi:hypothetical protein